MFICTIKKNCTFENLLFMANLVSRLSKQLTKIQVAKVLIITMWKFRLLGQVNKKPADPSKQQQS